MIVSRSESHTLRMVLLRFVIIGISLSIFLAIALSSLLFIVQMVNAQSLEVNDARQASRSYASFHIIQDNSYFDKSGNLHIAGEVQNTFEFPIQSVKVTATLYGSQKNIVGRQSAYAYIDQLISGEKSGFNIIIPMNVTKNATGYSLLTSYIKSGISSTSSSSPPPPSSPTTITTTSSSSSSSSLQQQQQQ